MFIQKFGNLIISDTGKVVGSSIRFLQNSFISHSFRHEIPLVFFDFVFILALRIYFDDICEFDVSLDPEVSRI